MGVNPSSVEMKANILPRSSMGTQTDISPRVIDMKYPPNESRICPTLKNVMKCI